MYDGIQGCRLPCKIKHQRRYDDILEPLRPFCRPRVHQWHGEKSKPCDLYAMEQERKQSRAGTITRAHIYLPRLSSVTTWKLQPWQFPRQLQCQLRSCGGRRGSSVVKTLRVFASLALKTFPRTVNNQPRYHRFAASLLSLGYRLDTFTG
jgi:hypothetical protein